MKWITALLFAAATNALAAESVPPESASAAPSSTEGDWGSSAPVPLPPWPAGDERGMGNTQGPGTRQRCATYLANPYSREYELSHPRTNTMPMSPFAVRVVTTPEPTFGPAFSRHAVNGETVTGEPGNQGT